MDDDITEANAANRGVIMAALRAAAQGHKVVALMMLGAGAAAAKVTPPSLHAA
jgi:hypothetical protein